MPGDEEEGEDGFDIGVVKGNYNVGLRTLLCSHISQSRSAV